MFSSKYYEAGNTIETYPVSRIRITVVRNDPGSRQIWVLLEMLNEIFLTSIRRLFKHSHFLFVVVEGKYYLYISLQSKKAKFPETYRWIVASFFVNR